MPFLSQDRRCLHLSADIVIVVTRPATTDCGVCSAVSCYFIFFLLLFYIILSSSISLFHPYLRIAVASAYLLTLSLLSLVWQHLILASTPRWVMFLYIFWFFVIILYHSLIIHLGVIPLSGPRPPLSLVFCRCLRSTADMIVPCPETTDSGICSSGLLVYTFFAIILYHSLINHLTISSLSQDCRCLHLSFLFLVRRQLILASTAQWVICLYIFLIFDIGGRWDRARVIGHWGNDSTFNNSPLLLFQLGEVGIERERLESGEDDKEWVCLFYFYWLFIYHCSNMIVCQQDKAMPMPFLPLVMYGGLLAPPPPWLSPSLATTASVPFPKSLRLWGLPCLSLYHGKGRWRGRIDFSGGFVDWVDWREETWLMACLILIGHGCLVEGCAIFDGGKNKIKITMSLQSLLLHAV